MNTRFLILAISVAALSSCSSVYRSGSTPDDLYYSSTPARQQVRGDDSYVDVRQQKDGSNYQSYEQYQDSYRDDRFLRMSVGNPYYMNSYNSYGAFDWRYNSFYDGFNYGYSSPWNNYFAWNSFYNPYSPGLYLGYGGLGYSSFYGGGYGGYYGGGGGFYGGGVKYSNIAPISKPRVFNVSSYSNSSRNANRTYTNGNYYNNNNGRYNNSNNNGGNNRTNNTYYNNNNNARSSYPSNNNTNNSYTPSPSRSYTPSSGGGGGSSSGGGGGGVSRPSRGN